MSNENSIKEGLKKLKSQKLMIIGGLFIMGFMLVSWLFAPGEERTKKEDIPVVNKDNVDFNVKLDTIENKVSTVFSERKGVEIKEKNPFEKKKEKKEINDKLDYLDNLGKTPKKKKPAPDPYKNDDMWNIDTNTNSSLGLENQLSEEEKIQQKIERRKKMREELRNKNNSKGSQKVVAEKIDLRAYIFRDQLVLPKSNVNITLQTGFTFKGKYYKSGFKLFGTVEKVQDNKVYISVSSIPGLELNAWDARRNHEGLYFTEAGILEQELRDEIEDEGLNEVARETRGGWVRAVASVLKSNKKRNFTYIPLPNDHELELKNY